MKTPYIKDEAQVFADSENRFIYEVLVYVWFNNGISLANSKLFASAKEIKTIIESYFVDNNIEFFTTLYAAPKSWLLKNDFVVYEKKKKQVKK